MTPAAIDNDLLEQAVRRIPNDARAAARRRALARFRETGFPTTRHENWKYTNLAPAVDISNRWLRDAVPSIPDAALSPAAREYAETLALSIDAHWLVIANGVVQKEPRADLAGWQLPGVEVASAAEGGETDALVSDDPLSLFNAALRRDALHVRLAPGVELDRPLGILVFDEPGDGRTVSLPRIVVSAGANARASIVEVHASGGGDEQFANALVDVDLARGAALCWLRLQERRRPHCQVGRLNVRLSRDSVFDHAAFDLGGGLVRNDIAADIVEPGAAVALHGLYLAGGRQHIDNHKIGRAHV